MRTLILINLAGLRYGVWEDEVRSVREVDTVHRLPLVPACIAGMSIIDDRTVTLADLSVCIGLPPAPHDKKAHLLIMSEEEKVAGFLVTGDIGRINVPDEAVFRMPRYLSTVAVDTCVEYNGVIPVINVSDLFRRVMKADREPPVADFGVSRPAETDLSSISEIRVFDCAGERYASYSRGIAPESVRISGIARLSLMPPYVRGVGIHDGAAMPIISLARKMGLPKPGPEEVVIIAALGEERFGFLVDSDIGRLLGRDFTIRTLPPLTVCGWMHGAAVVKGHILPLIGLGPLMAGSMEDTPLPERYSPDSDFQHRFGRQDVEIVEFLLLGGRHALPKSEVVDVYPLRSYRSVPNVQPIVAGVAEHDGELLPVLDLAAVFGRRSYVTPRWKMLLVENGDFRAFVLTEDSFGGRRLPQEVHRAVPIVLPHSVVYGCYPEGPSVRLILNVHALAVHFDRTLVKEFLGALSKEMEQAPSELLPDLLPPEYAPEREGVVGMPASLAEAAPRVPVETAIDATSEDTEDMEHAEAVPQVSVGIGAETSVARADVSNTGEDRKTGLDEKARVEAEEETRLAEEKARLEEERARLEREEQARREAEEQARAAAEAERIRLEQEKARFEAEEKARREAEERARQEAETARREAEENDRVEAERMRTEMEEKAQEEERLRLEQERLKKEAEEKARLEEERARLEREEQARREAEEQARAAAEAERIRLEQEKAGLEAEEKARREAEERARQEGETARREAEEKARLEAEAKKQETRAIIEEAEELTSRKEDSAKGVAASPMTSGRPYSSEPGPAGQATVSEHRSSLRKAFSSVALVAIIIGLLFYMIFKTPSLEIKKIETSAEIREEGPGAGRAKAKTGPLVLTVPKDSQITEEVYIVKKGDTLWHISRRFTGNPFNYPRVARDNRIANPDLIFPDQKIRIVKEQ